MTNIRNSFRYFAKLNFSIFFLNDLTAKWMMEADGPGLNPSSESWLADVE